MATSPSCFTTDECRPPLPRSASHGDTMSIATRTDTQSPALHVADSHDLIRVQGAREQPQGPQRRDPEAPRPSLEGPLGSRTRLTCALGGGAAEEHERADELVVPLLRPQAQQLELLPVVGRPDAPSAPRCVHPRTPSLTARDGRAAGTEGCHRNGCAARSTCFRET